MSRLKKFTRSLLSGYLALGANIFYSLASIPLALHYLGAAEFGLWALVSQLGGYILLIDMGMSASLARILIDHKDDRSNGAYGSVIKSGVLVGLVQGAIIVAVGMALSELAGPLLHIQAELRGEFFWLMCGQAALLGFSFTLRIFNQLLFAHQRLDISNYGSAVFLLVSLAAMWLGFRGNIGIYSYLIGQVLLTLGTVATNVIGSLRLGLLPKPGEWGETSKKQFRELFSFGQGMFLISVGSQMINASQTILLTRLLGLETVATWNICTRAYTLMTMIVWRILDYSAPPLCEMVVRGEREKLLGRLRDITVLMAGLSVVGGIIFSVSNGSFVALLSMGKFSWPLINNVLLALWFFICTIVRIQTGAIAITKDLGFLRFIFLVEGFAFIGLNLLAHKIENMSLMLIFSIVCTLTFSLPYGLMRVRKYFGLRYHELALWLCPTWGLIWRLVPLSVATWWLIRDLPIKLQFTLGVGLLSFFGTATLLWCGLGKPLQTEFFSRVPAWVRKIFIRPKSSS
ncbi:MAG TPA: oligosaccharide flippase family protein [Verrucomicrobiae bacterium]